MVAVAAGHRVQGGAVQEAVFLFVEPFPAALNHQVIDQDIQEAAAIGFVQGVREAGVILVELEGKGGHHGVEAGCIQEDTVQRADISLDIVHERGTGPEADIDLGADTLVLAVVVAAGTDSPGKADHVTLHQNRMQEELRSARSASTDQPLTHFRLQTQNSEYPLRW